MTSLSRATFQIDENQSFEQGMFLPEESLIRAWNCWITTKKWKIRIALL